MRLAVVIIHGIGSASPDFADPMVAELRDRLADRGHDPDDVAFQPIHWADILGPRQRAYLEDARAAGPLDFLPLRRVVVEALGDAAAYQYVERPSPTYEAVNDRVRERIHDLWVDQLDEQPVPLVAIAHSFGSHVLSSYVWDTQQAMATGAAADASPFERFEHLAGITMLGSPLPLFTFAYDPVVPVAFPGDALSPAVAEAGLWLNLYDRDDVLGYPLQPIGPQYAAAVDADVEVNAGGPTTSWNPLSHLRYWTDDDVTRPVAEQLAALLDAT